MHYLTWLYTLPYVVGSIFYLTDYECEAWSSLMISPCSNSTQVTELGHKLGSHPPKFIHLNIKPNICPKCAVIFIYSPPLPVSPLSLFSLSPSFLSPLLSLTLCTPSLWLVFLFSHLFHYNPPLPPICPWAPIPTPFFSLPPSLSLEVDNWWTPLGYTSWFQDESIWFPSN